MPRTLSPQRLLFLSALLSTALGAAVLAAKDQPATRATTHPSTQPTAKAINKFCPVDSDNEVDPKVTIVYQGKVIGFCCRDCIKDFQKDPQQYMEKLK